MLYNIPWFDHTKKYLTIVLLDVWVDSNGWLLQTILLWTLLYLQLGEHDENFSRNLFLAAHKVFTSSTSPKNVKLSSKCLYTTSSNVYLFHSLRIPLNSWGFFWHFKFWMWNVIPFDFNLHFPDFQWGEASFELHKMVSYCIFLPQCTLFIQHDGYIYPSIMFIFLWTGFSMQLFIFFLLIGRNSFYVTWCVANMLLTCLFTYLYWLLVSGSFNTVCYDYLYSFLTWLLLTGGKTSWNSVHPS